MHTFASPYHRHRFPFEIIRHSVWLYFRFASASEILKKCWRCVGICLSYEMIRERCLKFGQSYANGLSAQFSSPGDQWHLDEVFLKINGRLHYLWCAVDQDGDVLNILVQSHRNKKAARKLNVVSPSARKSMSIEY